jgi:PEGA domain-containing protein
MHPALRVVSALVIVPYFCACSLFGPHTQTITVSSSPPGASVYVNGENIGSTPLRAKVSRREELLVEVRKPGYQTAFRQADRSLSTLGILDIVGGFFLLVPFVGLLAPAAWENEPETFGITLEPEAAGNTAKENR